MTPISTKTKTDSTRSFPNSERVYAADKICSHLRVPFREVLLSSPKRADSSLESNDPVRIYDCSGPWGDPQFQGNVKSGLSTPRSSWILNRGDVEEVQSPVAYIRGERTGARGFQPSTRRRFKAKTGSIVTQLHYVRQGIIAPGMEFVAIRESLGNELEISRNGGSTPRTTNGEPFGASIPSRITPEFVRS